MKSPIYYCAFKDSTIDLSQLAEVNDPFFVVTDYDRREPLVGFSYRFAASEKPIYWQRELRSGPTRRSLDEVPDPLLSVLEEKFFLHVQKDETAPASVYRESKSRDVILDEHGNPINNEMDINRVGGPVPLAIINMRRDVESLRQAWMKWKEIEPEVYGIIRQKLSATA